MLASATFVEPPKANPPPGRGCRRRSCGAAEGKTAGAAAAAAPPKENPAPAPALHKRKRVRGEREEEYKEYPSPLSLHTEREIIVILAISGNDTGCDLWSEKWQISENGR